MYTPVNKRQRRERRKKRFRSHQSGSSDRPRLVVNRTNKWIYAQIINDESHTTLASVETADIGKKKLPAGGEEYKSTRMQQSFHLGHILADKASKIGIKKVVFDRAGYKYHGRVKALAEGARQGGLEF